MTLRTPFEPSFTPAELEERRSRLNCSELPALLGLSRYHTPLELWLEKRGELPPRGDSDPMLMGRLIEPVLLDLYARRTGTLLDVKPAARTLETWPTLAGSADALVMPPHPAMEVHALPGVEAKNRGGFGERKRWGEPGTDGVPDEVLAQCVGYLAIYGRAMWDVVALFSGNEPAIFRVHRSAELETEVLERARAWWERHIVNGEQPDLDGSSAAHAYLARRFRDVTEQLRPASSDEDALIARLGQAKRAVAAAEAMESETAAALKLAIASHRGLEGPSGRVLWSPTKGRASTDWPALLADLVGTGRLAPDEAERLVATYTTTGAPGRQFRATFTEERSA